MFYICKDNGNQWLFASDDEKTPAEHQREHRGIIDLNNKCEI